MLGLSGQMYAIPSKENFKSVETVNRRLSLKFFQVIQ